MKTWTAVALCALLVAGCGGDEDRILFDGQSFNAKLRKVDQQSDVFTVTVKPVSRSLDGAVAAGEYEAIKHCVNTYGTSDIVWTIGPDTPQGQLPIEKDVLTLQGRCPDAR